MPSKALYKYDTIRWRLTISESLGNLNSKPFVILEVTGFHPLYIGAYYRPHEDDLINSTEWRKSIEQVGKRNGNIWLLGDFNLPGLTWSDNIPLFRPNLTCKSVYFLDLVNGFGFYQMVVEPTRQDRACVHGSTNGTNGIPMSFKVLPMIPENVMGCTLHTRHLETQIRGKASWLFDSS